MNKMKASLIALAFLATPVLASAQAVSPEPGTAELKAAGAKVPNFAFYYNAETGTFVKPILAFAGGWAYEVLDNQSTNPNLNPMTTTTATAAFGFEGQLGDLVAFHTEFRRDPGFYGTSVWEGTASISSLDNWVRVQRWGGSLAAGIVTDPASVDFFSMHIGDQLMADDFSRALVLVDGFNRGQGVLAQYKWNGLTAGLSYVSGNPLSTSLSYGFGGAVSLIGTLFQVPLRNMVRGNPGGGTQIQAISPSLMFDHEYVSVKANVQFYNVNADTESKSDIRLRGMLYRGGVRGKLLGGMLMPFANFTYRKNDQYVQTASEIFYDQLDPDGHRGTMYSAGLDFNYSGLNGVGVNYGRMKYKTSSQPEYDQQYINIGTTYWLMDGVSVCGRYAKSITKREGKDVDDGIPDRDAVFLALRLMI